METFKNNAETMNAVIDAIAAVIFATVRRLPPDQQKAFADDLARLAQNAERNGRTTLETLLLDFHRAATMAP